MRYRVTLTDYATGALHFEAEDIDRGIVRAINRAFRARWRVTIYGV